jgi:hypothetical protein
MFYKRLSDQWECEADDAIAELERQQGRAFGEPQKAVFRKRGEHRLTIPDGSRWGDVKAASTNIGEALTKAMRAVADAYEYLIEKFADDAGAKAGEFFTPPEVVDTLVRIGPDWDRTEQWATPLTTDTRLACLPQARPFQDPSRLRRSAAHDRRNPPWLTTWLQYPAQPGVDLLS